MGTQNEEAKVAKAKYDKERRESDKLKKVVLQMLAGLDAKLTHAQIRKQAQKILQTELPDDIAETMESERDVLFEELIDQTFVGTDDDAPRLRDALTTALSRRHAREQASA